jgi:DNA-binding transcriptional LysR family regulator
MITLRQLRYLTSLARHRHFGRAAQDCAVSQPALSMQIRELEREIGTELVERRPGDIALTDTGLDVARRAEHILASARDLVDFARHRDVLSGPLKLGIIPTLAPYVLPRVLPLLQKRYPLLRLEVRETLTKPLLDELASGELDCVMLARSCLCSSMHFCWRCRRMMSCRRTGKSASPMSTSAVSFCWRKVIVCATRLWRSAPPKGVTSQRDLARHR